MKIHKYFPSNSPFLLQNENDYRRWREIKLEKSPEQLDALVVPVKSLADPTIGEIKAIAERCEVANMAVYSNTESKTGDLTPEQLRDFATRFNVSKFETHRSAGDSGVVSLEVSNQGTRNGYIPYTDLPLSWHTDGYYNEIDQPIRSMVLHCVRDAQEGGMSELLDPEIAYIRLRDRNPNYVSALMHPGAMTIPANTEPDGSIRPERIGPVFSIDRQSGALHMRYSARGRNISWRTDDDTTKARQYLHDILEGAEARVFRTKLKPGQGLICNNVLHRRTGFKNPPPDAAPGRLLYRLRCTERIGHADAVQ